jgi:uncharacterized protein (DUF2235 family)
MKRLLFCLDGTGNDPRDAEQREDKGGEVTDNSITNVLKLHLLAGGRLDNSQSSPEQHSLYYCGVGTCGSIFRRGYESFFARHDPKRIQKEVYDDLCRYYEPGDEIFVFGFSRGAAIGRKLAVHITKNGVVRDGTVVAAKPEIKMLGVWDTVASFGKPNLHDDRQPVSDVLFEDCSVADAVQKAYHLLALDETRLAFRPTLINACEKASEVWFSGVHSDIGGGYLRDGLSDVTLRFMLEKAGECGVSFIDAGEIDYSGLRGDEGIRIEENDIVLEPDPMGYVHRHRGSEVARELAFAPRQVCVTVDDRPSEILPLIHHSVAERIRRDATYRPESLQGLKHRVLQQDGTISEHSGLEAHLGNI